MNAINPADIFPVSSPETRPDWCDSVGTWSVAHAQDLAEALGADRWYAWSDDTKATHRIRVAPRFCRTRSERTEALAVLEDHLASMGFRARIDKTIDHVVVSSKRIRG